MAATLAEPTTSPSAPVRRTLDQGLVLVADDDLQSRAAVAELLVDLDYWPVTARNGLEALELLRRGVTPSALLIDLYMPLMDGEAFCAAVDEMPELAHVPRIIVSANPDARARVERCGATAFLAKPIVLEQLEAALKAIKPSVT